MAQQNPRPPEKRRTEIALLPTVSDLAKLTPEVASEVLRFADRVNQRETGYATLGAVCGASCFLCCAGVFVYLVETGHPAAAGTVLGTAVLGIVGKFIDSRIRK
jgi:hypothetical protein